MIRFKQVFYKYLDNGLKLEKWQKMGVFCLVFVLSGILGWVYEFVFYYFNGGMKEFYLQGGNFLPWINIYAFGAILVGVLTYKLKKKPILVFLVSVVATGVLEYVAGWLVFKIGNGTRFWDYNTEIWNFGNIDGFVCLRSVLVFGVLSMGLVYGLVPFLVFLSKKMGKKTFLTLAVTLFVVFLADEVYNSLLTRMVPGLPSAVDIFESQGFRYVKQGWT